MNQKGITPLVTLIAITVIVILAGCGYYFLTSKANYTSQETKSPQVVVTPNETSKPASASPQALHLSISTWEMIGTANIELLVTDQSGNQTGYLPSTRLDVNRILNAGYYVGGGITDPSTGRSMADHPDFSAQNPSNGTYQLEIIGKELGDYNVDVYLTSGSGQDLKDIPSPVINGKITHINQVDKYSITLPDGNIQNLIN